MQPFFVKKRHSPRLFSFPYPYFMVTDRLPNFLRRGIASAPAGCYIGHAIHLSDFIFHFLQKNPLDRPSFYFGSTVFLLQYVFLKVFQIFCIWVR